MVNMEKYVAKLNNVRISPRKLVLVANLVKNMDAEAAVTQLNFLDKRGAEMVRKTIESARANAENNHGATKEGLIVKNIFVTPAVTFKRGRAVSRGRYFKVLKRGSNLTVELIKK